MTEEKRRKIDDVDYVKLAVHETLSAIGFDLREPQEIQRDISWLRTIRKRSENVGERAIQATSATFVGALLYSLWLGVKKMMAE
jgi:hypothetical protein